MTTVGPRPSTVVCSPAGAAHAVDAATSNAATIPLMDPPRCFIPTWLAGVRPGLMPDSTDLENCTYVHYAATRQEPANARTPHRAHRRSGERARGLPGRGRFARRL